VRCSQPERSQIIRLVKESDISKRRLLQEIDSSTSSFYRCLDIKSVFQVVLPRG